MESDPKNILMIFRFQNIFRQEITICSQRETFQKDVLSQVGFEISFTPSQLDKIFSDCSYTHDFSENQFALFNAFKLKENPLQKNNFSALSRGRKQKANLTGLPGEPIRKQTHIERNASNLKNDPIINSLIKSYQIMESNIKKLKDCVPLLGNVVFDTKPHAKFLEDIDKTFQVHNLNENSKPEIKGIIAFDNVLMILSSVMLGHIKHLMKTIPLYNDIEDEEKELVSKILYSYYDITQMLSTSMFEKILNLLLVRKPDSPAYCKITHNLFRIFLNLHIRIGKKGGIMTTTFRDDINFLNTAIDERSIDDIFQLAEFDEDFIENLKLVACSESCLKFYNRINHINNGTVSENSTKTEIMSLIDNIIRSKCFFTKLSSSHGETLYTDQILIDVKMRSFKRDPHTKLELIFTILHEICHIKRIKFSFSDDHLSNSPADFIKQFPIFNSGLSPHEQKEWLENPEIGNAFELVVFGNLYKFRKTLVQSEKYCSLLLNPSNWNQKTWEEIEEEIRPEQNVMGMETKNTLAHNKEFDESAGIVCNTGLISKLGKSFYDLFLNNE